MKLEIWQKVYAIIAPIWAIFEIEYAKKFGYYQGFIKWGWNIAILGAVITLALWFSGCCEALESSEEALPGHMIYCSHWGFERAVNDYIADGYIVTELSCGYGRCCAALTRYD